MLNNQVFIITGVQGSGKTTFLQTIVEKLKSKGLVVGGFLAEGFWENNSRSGFELLAINDGRSIKLCTNKPTKNYLKLGYFWFNPEAILMGKDILESNKLNADIMVIDEIGIFELQEKIWYTPFKELLYSFHKPVIISVREKIVEEVIEKFELSHMQIFKPDDKLEGIFNKILSVVKK